jgi:hypothetical protein
MVMTLYMTVVKQHSTHHDTNNNNMYDIINHCDAIPNDIMWSSELKYANRYKA